MTGAPIATGRTLSVTETMEAGSFNDIHEALLNLMVRDAPKTALLTMRASSWDGAPHHEDLILGRLLTP
jgi:hypothetical protein